MKATRQPQLMNGHAKLIPRMLMVVARSVVSRRLSLSHHIIGQWSVAVGCCSRSYITRRLFIKFGVFRVKTTLTMPIITLIKIIYSNKSAAAVIVVATAVAVVTVVIVGYVWTRIANPPLTRDEIARR